MFFRNTSTDKPLCKSNPSLVQEKFIYQLNGYKTRINSLDKELNDAMVELLTTMMGNKESREESLIGKEFKLLKEKQKQIPALQEKLAQDPYAVIEIYKEAQALFPDRLFTHEQNELSTYVESLKEEKNRLQEIFIQIKSDIDDFQIELKFYNDESLQEYINKQLRLLNEKIGHIDVLKNQLIHNPYYLTDISLLAHELKKMTTQKIKQIRFELEQSNKLALNVEAFILTQSSRDENLNITNNNNSSGEEKYFLTADDLFTSGEDSEGEPSKNNHNLTKKSLGKVPSRVKDFPLDYKHSQSSVLNDLYAKNQATILNLSFQISSIADETLSTFKSKSLERINTLKENLLMLDPGKFTVENCQSDALIALKEIERGLDEMSNELDKDLFEATQVESLRQKATSVKLIDDDWPSIVNSDLDNSEGESEEEENSQVEIADDVPTFKL